MGLRFRFRIWRDAPSLVHGSTAGISSSQPGPSAATAPKNHVVWGLCRAPGLLPGSDHARPCTMGHRSPPFWCPNLLIYFGMCTGAPCEPRIPTWTPVPSWYGFPRIWHTPTRRHGPSPLWSGRQQTGSHHEPDDQHGRRRMQDGNRSLWGRRTPASESRPPLPQGLRQCPVSGQGVSASRVLTRFGVA